MFDDRENLIAVHEGERQQDHAGGIVILTTHQPLNVETDKVRRIALTSERATQ